MNDVKTKCKQCNSIIDEDGTALNCTGECGRMLMEDWTPEQALDFDTETGFVDRWAEGWDKDNLLTGDTSEYDYEES